MSDNLITELVQSNRELAAQCATAVAEVKAMSDRFDKLEKRVFGPDGVSTDVDAIKEKFSYARGWIAGWAFAIGLGGAGAAITVQSILKKIGWLH